MRKQTSALTALPVFNEVKHVGSVLDKVVHYGTDVLVVDDGSTDGTAAELTTRDDVHVINHGENRGYGAALKTAFDFAGEQGYEYLVTIDCDGQHEPKRIPLFIDACHDVDIVSGSRYLREFAGDSAPPIERKRINSQITQELNQRLHLQITDAFCGFKAYRVPALRELALTETGYAMPLQLWVQASARGLRIKELAVPLIYLDEERSFGGVLDDGESRLAYYRQVINCSLAQLRKQTSSATEEQAGCR